MNMLFTKRYQESFLVKGMMCEKCASRVREACLALPGVKKVIVRLEEGKVTLVSAREIDAEKVAETVKSLGYSFEGKAR